MMVLGARGAMGYVLGRGAGAAAAQWWLSGGVSAANCVAAFLQRLCGKRTFRRNATQDTSTQTIVRDAKFSCPISNGLSLAVVGNESVPTGIVGLLNIIRPSAIIRRVRPITIDTFNRVFRRWSRPHVGIEVFKGVLPPVAHDDTSTAVMFVYPGFGVVAPRLDTDPNIVFWSVRHSVCGAVSLNAFRRQAATAFRVATGQIINLGSRCVTAVANQFPVRSASFAVPIKCDNGQPVKSLATVIFDSFAWQWGSINLYHVAILP